MEWNPTRRGWNVHRQEKQLAIKSVNIYGLKQREVPQNTILISTSLLKTNREGLFSCIHSLPDPKQRLFQSNLEYIKPGVLESEDSATYISASVIQKSHCLSWTPSFGKQDILKSLITMFMVRWVLSFGALAWQMTLAQATLWCKLCLQWRHDGVAVLSETHYLLGFFILHEWRSVEKNLQYLWHFREGKLCLHDI